MVTRFVAAVLMTVGLLGCASESLSAREISGVDIDVDSLISEETRAEWRALRETEEYKRYEAFKIPSKKYTSEESRMIHNADERVSKSEQQCIYDYYDEYTDKLYDLCVAADAGRNIGGGCAHIVGYSIDTSVVETALAACGIDWRSGEYAKDDSLGSNTGQ
ncbi:MAG: hypothetical protein DHS20C05_19900 [Hyphococcus sp.]|nr:MAG: hypothetical protein DHS20C05_19900 [Marinicaulis sp.]